MNRDAHLPPGDSEPAASQPNRQLAEGILALSLCRDEQEIYAAALAGVQAIYPSPHWAIGDVLAGEKHVVLRGFSPGLVRHFGPSLLGMRFPILGRAFSTSLYDDHRVTFVGDAPGDPASIHPEFVAVYRVRSLLGIPLLFEDRVVGAIFGAAFLDETSLVADEGAFEALHSLARVTAIALQRLRARKALEEALERTALLSEVFREMAIAQREEELLRVLFRGAAKLAPLPCWWFNVFDAEQQCSRTKYWTPNLEAHLSPDAIQATFSIEGHPLVAKTHVDRELLWFPDALDHPWFPRESREAFPVRSLVCVPLWDSEQGVGVLCGASLDPDPPVHLEPDQREALERLGQAAGMALGRLVAQRHQAESEQRYKALFDHAVEAVLILDDSRYLMANDAACRMLGRTQEEIRHQPPGFFSPEFQPSGERSSDLAWAYAARSLKEGPQRFPWLHNGPGGTSLTTEVTLAPFTEGDRRYFQVLVRDMTQAKRIEEEKRTLEQQLFQAQKLESLGVLAGGVAHDFNNLLMGILGHADVALEFGNPPAGLREHLVAIQQSGHRAADLTRQMLAYSGRGHFVIQRVDLSQEVASLVALLEGSVPKSVILDLQLAKGLPGLTADSAQLQQVIMNLVINAAEAIGDQNGHITLRTELVRLESEDVSALVEGVTLEPGTYLRLEVRDSGTGMDEDTQRRIFEPFFTTKFTGRGLGLSAILGIVRGHRGGLSVVSKAGAGTVFRVYLPPALDSLPATPAPECAPLRPGKEALVLVVDDEAGVRRIAREILEAGGYRVVEAWDGEGGLERLEALGEEVALVLLDVTMPRMNGATTFKALRRTHPHLPVILSSGFSEPEAVRHLQGVGPVRFLQKPYSARALLDQVQGALGA